jgi:hypothetical protein
MLNDDRNLELFDLASIMEHIAGSMIFENLPTDRTSLTFSGIAGTNNGVNTFLSQLTGGFKSECIVDWQYHPESFPA